MHNQRPKFKPVIEIPRPQEKLGKLKKLNNTSTVTAQPTVQTTIRGPQEPAHPHTPPSSSHADRANVICAKREGKHEHFLVGSKDPRKPFEQCPGRKGCEYRVHSSITSTKSAAKQGHTAYIAPVASSEQEAVLAEDVVPSIEVDRNSSRL